MQARKLAVSGTQPTIHTAVVVVVVVSKWLFKSYYKSLNL